MLDSLRLGECEIFALVLQSRREVDGEVAVVHLVDDEVARVAESRTHVVSPALRVGIAQVDDGTAFAVHAHRLGEDAGCVVGLCAVVHAEEVVLAFEVALHGELPLACAYTLHLLCEQLCGAVAVCVR